MRTSRFNSIQWKRHDASQRRLSARLREFVFESLPAAVGFETQLARQKSESPLRNAMLENAPVVAAASAIEEARFLLEAAAEIEHALLVEYLYAAMSLKPTPIKRSVTAIAVQEMSHLLTVQNLLLFLGGSPYFERFDLSPNPELDPFPFQLCGMRQKETLERFVLAEMPILEALQDDDRIMIEEIKQRLDPNGAFNRVGVLYARLYWLFQTGSGPEGPWTDVANIGDVGPLPQWHIEAFPGNGTAATTQASRTELGPRGEGNQGEIWFQDYSGGGAFATIESRASALQAIYDVASQGEGLAAGSGDSHFGVFFNTLKNIDELPPNRLLPVPANPSTVAAAGRIEITDPAARSLCKFLNVRYQIMLVALARSLLCSVQDAQQNEHRQTLVQWAFYEMRVAIPGLVSEIVQRPCLENGDAGTLCAAPTFELDDVELAGDSKSLEAALRRLHVHARVLKAELGQLGFGTADSVAEIDIEDRKRYPDI